MTLKKLKDRPELVNTSKLGAKYNQLAQFLNKLEAYDISEALANQINAYTIKINDFEGTNKDLLKLLNKVQSKLLMLVEKHLKVVPRNYYRNLWLSLGMAVFGIPMGIVFGMSLGNMAFLGVGLPIGLALGQAYGTTLDKKAQKEGRQIQVDF